METKLAHVHLESGKPYALKVDYGPSEDAKEPGQLVWSQLDLKPSAEAIAAARNSDVVLAVVGLTSELEGEEMPVSEEGFKEATAPASIFPSPNRTYWKAWPRPANRWWSC